MNRREVAITAAAVAPGVLLLGLLFGGGHHTPDAPPAPVIVHQIPAQIPAGTVAGVDA